MSASETYLSTVHRRTTDTALSLPRNFAWSAAGNVVYAACQWGVLITIARLGSTVEVGQLGLGIAVAAPIFMFTNLQLRAIQATDAAQEYSFRDYLRLRLLTTALALPFVAGTILTVGYRRETAWIILAVALSKAFDSVSDVCYGLFQLHERMDYVARSMLTRGVLGLAGVALLERITGNLLWSITVMALAWLVVLVIYDLGKSRALLGPSGVWDTGPGESLWASPILHPLVPLVRQAAPMGIVMMLVSLIAHIPRYFVEHYHGEHQLGLFTAMAYLGIAGVTLVGAMGTSASPRLAKLYHSADLPGFRRLTVRLMVIALSAGALGVVVALLEGRQILRLFYGVSYAEEAGVLVWLMVAAALGYAASVLGVAVTSARIFRAQAPLFVFVATTAFISCLVLVPSYGLLGAAWSSCVAMVVQIAGMSLLYRIAIRRLVRARTATVNENAS